MVERHGYLRLLLDEAPLPRYDEVLRDAVKQATSAVELERLHVEHKLALQLRDVVERQRARHEQQRALVECAKELADVRIDPDRVLTLIVTQAQRLLGPPGRRSRRRRGGRGRAGGRAGTDRHPRRAARPGRSGSAPAWSASVCVAGTAWSPWRPTPSRRWSRSSRRPAWARSGRCARRTSGPARCATGSPRSSLRCWWPSTATGTAASGSTSAPRSRRCRHSCRRCGPSCWCPPWTRRRSSRGRCRGRSALWRLAERHRVTWFGTSAPFVQSCLRAGLRPRDDVDLSALRAVGSTGSPLSAEGFRWIGDAVGEHVQTPCATPMPSRPSSSWPAPRRPFDR